MATKIVTKNSSTASAVPTASDLVQGELAVNVADKRLFTEDNAGAIVELGTNPSTLTVTGEITANGGIALGDGDVATFGDSDDLSIFHAGGTTYLTNTTGSLVLRTDSFRVLNTANSEQILHGDANGAVTAYYDNSVKLATTASGVHLGAGSVNATLSTESAGTSNLTLGVNAGNSIVSGGNYNTVVGDEAGTAVTTADYTTAIGYAAGLAVTTGVQNTLIGGLAGDALTTGSYNSLVGVNSGGALTTGAQNVAFGQGALATNTTGSTNTALGDSSLSANTTASNNTAVGQAALTANTTGASNTSVGTQAGGAITTGNNNICIGLLAGNHDGAIVTGGQNTMIGNYTDTNATSANNVNVFGYNVTGSEGYTTLGVGADDIRAAHGTATWAAVSDQRYKKDIVDSTTGLSFINALQPRTFKYKTLGELPETFRAYEEGSTEVFKSSQTQHGFIAQEIKAAIDADDSIKDGFKLWDDREDGSQEVAEAALIPILSQSNPRTHRKNRNPRRINNHERR